MHPPNPRSAYQAFVQDFLQANDWAQRRDGVPLDLLDALHNDDLERAEDAMLKRLSECNDDWPVIGLGHIKSKRAVEPLLDQLESAARVRAAAIGAALWKITGKDRFVEPVLKASKDAYQDNDRQAQSYDMLEIIVSLAAFPHTAVTERLEQLLKSKNSLIAYNAKEALQRRRGGVSD